MKLCLNGTSSFRGHYLTFELSSSTIFGSRSEKKKREITGDWSGIPSPMTEPPTQKVCSCYIITLV